MLFSEEYYRDLIAKLGLPEMPIVRAERQRSLALDALKFRVDFAGMVKKFVQFAAYNNLDQLAMADICFETISDMRDGNVPENISVYMKVPVEYGGKLEFSNMFLIRTRPFKAILDKFFDEQVLAFNKELGSVSGLEKDVKARNTGFVLPEVLFVPNPKGIVFVPALKGFAGAGGNATTDQMSEIGSTMFLNNNGRF